MQINTDQGISDAIRFTRILCIFLMMYAHVPHAENSTGVLNTVSLFLENRIALASVPLLSVVSGWLFVKTYKGSAVQSIRKKIRSLLIPMVLWCSVVITIYEVAAVFINVRYDFPENSLQWLSGFLSIADHPFDRPLYFLHDLFICTMIGTLILSIDGNRYRILCWWIALVLGVILSVFAPQTYFMQRALLLPTFLTGMLIGLSEVNVLSRTFISPLLAAMALCGAIALYFLPSQISGFDKDSEIANIIILSERFMFAVVAWYIIVRTYKFSSTKFLSFEKYVFFVFCSHFIVFKSIEAILFRFISRESNFVYVFTFLDPIFGVIFGIIGYEILKRISPLALAYLTGGRVK